MNLEPRTSNLEPRTSNLEPRTSNLEPRTSNLEPRTSNLEPRTSKKVFVTLVFIVMASISILDMITMREDFPFAPYTMYSGIYKDKDDPNPAPPCETLKLIFINSKGEELPEEGRFVYPLSILTLKHGLQNTLDSQDATRIKLKYVLDQLEKRATNDSSLPRPKRLKLMRNNHIIIEVTVE